MFPSDRTFFANENNLFPNNELNCQAIFKNWERRLHQWTILSQLSTKTRCFNQRATGFVQGQFLNCRSALRIQIKGKSLRSAANPTY